jgi:hypothetical protein
LPGKPPRSLPYSAMAPGALTAAASAIGGAAACPPCSLPAAGRRGAAFLRPRAFRGATAGFDSWAAPQARFRRRDDPRHGPSGLRRRFVLAALAGAGVAAGSALAFRAAAHPFLCAAATRRRAAGVRCASALRREQT